MKKTSVLFGIAALLTFMLLLSGCTENYDELHEENENLNNVIEDMTDEIDHMTDKVTDLVSEAEENWGLLQECIDEKQKENDETVVIVASKETFNVDSWSMIDSFMHDITGDDNEDKISLYTSAAKDEAGNIMWDDGQYFMVSLYDGEKTYNLFNERVQIGRVYYSIADSDETGLFVTVSTYSGIRFIKFTYSKAENYFMGKTLFSTEGVNVIHNTLPWD